jgi:sugar phosphate isomerase/epimerase
VGASNLKVQMDLYHCQIVEGDVAMKIRQYLPTGRVGHFQIAGVPERHEPDVGEVNYPYLFERDRRGGRAMRLARLGRLRVPAANAAASRAARPPGWAGLALRS